MPRDPYIRNQFTLTHTAARKRAKAYFAEFPKALYQTEVESWEKIQSDNYTFVMKRLREPVEPKGE